jgi:hypothetical protein
MTEDAMDRVRQAALAEVEQGERRTGWLLAAAGLFEAVVFVAILFIIDWGDATHLVVFLCACLVYAPLAFGLVSLHSALDAATQRVLAGIRFGVE